MNIECVIYQLLTSELIALPPKESSSGKKFEDFVVQQLFKNFQQTGFYRTFPPRFTLREQTFSGVFHQFDVVVAFQQELTAIECKFRGSAGIDELFATNGKLIDYKKQPRGIFVTTSNSVNKEMYLYALAHKIELISSQLPPLGYMLQHMKRDCYLFEHLERLRKRMLDGSEPNRLFVEWQNASIRFHDEGYS